MRRTRQSCSGCASVAQVVCSLQQENAKLTAALTAQTELVGGLLRKAMDCAMLQPEAQMDRVMAEQDTARARAMNEPVMPRPSSRMRDVYTDEPGEVSVRMPSAGGGMGV